MNTITRTLVVILTALCFTVAVSAATFVVDTTNDTADATPGNGVCADALLACSLRAAISEANALTGDDTITVPAGTYTQTLVAANEDANAGGDWDISTNITINGAGSATTIFQANAAPATATERVMEVTSATAVVIINGVTLRHGNKTGAAAVTTRGGGIRNFGTLTLNNCIVTLNNASGAGGVRNERTVTITNSTISNNGCNNGGATCFGGGMYNTLAANSAVTITNVQFNNNTSTSPGANGFGFAAGLGIESTTGFTLNITGSSFNGNTGVGTGTGGSNGNGIRMLPTATSVANITTTTFTNNGGSGGSSIQGSGITAFTGLAGTGTFTGTWDRITVSGNTGTGAGGGVFVDATSAPITINVINSTINGNDAGTTGGGVSLTNVGGTAASAVTFNFTNSTISGNTAGTNGGGVFVEQPVATSVVTANFNYCTIAGQTAGGTGGGLAKAATGVINVKNSIVALNLAPSGPDMVGTINSQDYNHFGSTAGATITGTTTNNATGDPDIGLLGSNGGPTQTRLPNATSPVLNTIPNGVSDCGTTVTIDQRLLPRPSGGACDKGSVERAGLAPGPWDLSGVIKDANGRPIRNIQVVITGGSLPGPIIIYTGMLGEYGVLDLPGASYTVTVAAKRFTFTPNNQVVNLGADTSNVNFTADPGFGVQPPVGKDGVLLADKGILLSDGVLIGDRNGGIKASVGEVEIDGALGDRGNP